MYLCSSLVDGVCQEWSEYTGIFPPLTVEEGVTLGLAVGGVWATAWGLRQIVGVLINR